jgi:hypothetical protein
MKLQEEQSGWSETMTADEESQQSMPPQRPFSDVYSRGSPVAKRQKVCFPDKGCSRFYSELSRSYIYLIVAN